MKTRAFLLTIALFFSLNLFGQRIKTVEGEYTFHAPENMSPAEARRVALDRAMSTALANEFGTLVSQNTSTVIKNSDADASAQFFSIGGSEVKGEWIRTIGEPEYHISYEQDMLIVNCKVKGEAREIEATKIDLDCRILRNGTDTKFENREFKNNDDMFVYFKSPESGYLALFLLDEATADVSLLLPYQAADHSSYPVKKGKEYVFFSDKTCDKSEIDIVDSLILLCEQETEYNTIYVVFSPNRFAAPFSDKKYLDVPVIPYEEFSKWLTKNRKHDKNMNVLPITVKINR